MIKLTNISKKFGKDNALNNINAEFPENKMTVIVGPSGAGKSTLLRTLNFLTMPDSGQYDFDDINLNFENNVSSKDILNVRRKTGMVFQGYNLFPHLTVIKNVMEGPVQVLGLSKSDAHNRAINELKQLGLDDKANQYPNQLSGGQAQRVAIARSLAMQPEYIFLDEPTSALDPEIESGIIKILLRIKSQQQSMVMVTHNLLLARKLADQIIFIDNGEVLFKGTIDEFFNSKKPRIAKFVNATNLENI